MNIAEKLRFKSSLKNYCLTLIEQRINHSRQAMNQAQHAANSEEKSSAGDKYETSRAMNQRERDMFAQQLDAALQELSLAASIDCSRINSTAVPGTVIISQNACFFIFAGLGKVKFEGRDVFVISSRAPLIEQFFQKKCEESFIINGKTDYIIEIF